MLLYLCLASVLVVALACIAILLIQEMQAKSRTKFYEKQGFIAKIEDWVGGEVSLYQNEAGCVNHLQLLYNLMAKAKAEGRPGLVFNMPHWGCASLYLSDVGVIREFFAKEYQHTRRTLPGDLKTNLGFIFEQGEKGLEHRAIFSEFFSYTHMNKLIPAIRKIIEKEFELLTVKEGKLVMENGSKRFIEHLVLTIINMLIFGEDVQIPKAESGLTFFEELLDLLSSIFPGIIYDKANRVMRDLLNRFDLIPSAKRARHRSKFISSALQSFIEKRRGDLHSKQREAGFCLIDMMLLHNEKSSQGKLTMEDMIGNCNLFLVAGYDTTATAMCSMIYAMATVPDLYQLVADCSKDLDRYDVTREQLEQNDILEKLMRESIRLYPPSAFVFERLVMKDFTLAGGKLVFKSGDKIQVPLGPLMWQEDVFGNLRSFDLNCINEKSKKNYMPFSIGKRNCVGQSLVSIEMKLLAAFISQRFKLKALDLQPKYITMFTMKMVDCDVSFQLKY